MSTPARPSLNHARRVRSLHATIVAVVVTVTAIFALTGAVDLTRPEAPAQAYDGPTPWDYSASVWQETLGGDSGLTAANFTTLDEWRDEDLGDSEVTKLRDLAQSVVTADLTDPEPDRWPGYWPTAAAVPATPRCTDVTVLARSASHLPVATPSPTYSQFAKVLVAYTASCGGEIATQDAPGITYMYAGLRNDVWQPLRSWQVPVASTVDQTAGATEPYEWELAEIDTACTDGVVVRARIAVAAAFDQMCQAAASAGVELLADSGYRTRAEQASLFADAVVYYGSQSAARKHVAYADDDVCDSKHCSGLAVNVASDPGALAWLQATVGCLSDSGQLSAASLCEEGTPVPQEARWGFAEPLASVPGYLEFTLPLGEGTQSSLAAPDCSPSGIPVANMVAAIFRCRLAREGVLGAVQDTVVAQALVVSRCESGWNSSAAAFGGRYATSPNPSDGKRYTHRGVFMLTSELSDAWVAGGAANVSDPVANINAAASLWLSTRGWEQFGCATGGTGGFEAGPVLAQYGGPALPAWSSTF